MERTLSARRPLSRALEGTLAGVARSLDDSLFAEEIARRPGLLQRLDPRVRVLGAFVLLLAVALARDVFAIAALYVVALVLAAASRVPMGFFVKRVWVFMPFFTGVIALPALFLTPGPPLVTLPFGWVITRPGALTTLLLLARVSTSVSLGVLLILSTRWNLLLKALSVLRVPEGFILVLGMTYRYLYLVLHTLEGMLLSRKSRVIASLTAAEERQVLAASAGALLGKSFALSNDVYLAMQSRGFLGQPRSLDTFRMRPGDWLALACALGAAALVVAVGR